MSSMNPIHAFENSRLLPLLSQLPSFEESLARLLYLVEHRRPCGLVLGPAGTGKSALLQVLFQELSAAELSGTSCRPLLIDLRAGSHTELSWALASEMGLSPGDTLCRESLWQLIEDRFHGAAMSGQPIVPIIDHVEQTDPADVAGLSLCCQLAVQYGSTVLLSARPPLRSNLADVVGPLCALRIELPSWTLEETTTFVSLAWEGAEPPRLSADAFAAIHDCGGGRLRETVQLMRLAVFAASTQGIDTIDADFLDTLVGELWQPATLV